MSEQTGTLYLQRALGEAVVIGPPDSPLCVVRVVRIRSKVVRLSFEAPPNVEINRGEIADAKLARQFEMARDVEVQP
ncbi:MAG TPA: carbon storage regulator [Phycisphaerales bacterium]|nr:carbon storage regulator [Phycisphaerales bacterium]